ncbi:hemolysin family protein [Coralloluteibacterium stylophorae]|uniref:HlyC/CorC family transporter n=1 Tax=Coralloluteibacterium stylophorae TaxID=1776034 RepID=A0A8J7VRJ2_9GAMM|nr:hemolysin family protein [Coralloluteibacterium stylophorae]MBS7456198.1 HlyC/CorC family transporter [Coralloluteibacterium stylophorae]
MALEILVVAVLILLNGFFALSEMSVVTARKARLRMLAETSRRARMAADLAEHPERFLSTVQVGITLIGILTGVFGGEAIGLRIAAALERLVPALAPMQGWFSAEGLGLTIAVVLITFSTIIVGELLPKRIALLAPEKLAMAVAAPMGVMARIAAPAVWLLSTVMRGLMKILRLERDGDGRISEDEIHLMLLESQHQGVIDRDERSMATRVLRLGDRTADSLMTPRTRIVWLDAGAARAENLATMRATPYSRYPVLRGGEEDIVGVLEVKSLLGGLDAGGGDLFAQLRDTLFVSESTPALKLIEIFREEEQTLALVVDEYGDIQGMVTLNDVLGAIVGRQGASERGSAQAQVVTRADGSLLVDGALSIDDLGELLDLREFPGRDEHDYHTLAGMAIAQWGRIPQVGEAFDWKDWRFEIVDLDGARIDKLLVQRAAGTGAAPADGA